jgi:hypothetical protein
VHEQLQSLAWQRTGEKKFNELNAANSTLRNIPDEHLTSQTGTQEELQFSNHICLGIGLSIFEESLDKA